MGEQNHTETGIVRPVDIVARLLQRCVGGGMTRQVMRDAADEIERLRAALRLAAVEVFGNCDPLTTSPDQLVEHFIEEARRA